ncbi:hypothetical protein EV189_1413 [Motilibacter rhizosphaerae]|uniref:Uncharacterized protein n=1 Tax=Motilibacter rhizosphaerae TaxID=598652 RepID=A0A4Q7NRE1_9ACTN|nr:hypothetical protein [Motilibacter rhizosphaerae]RZS89643.1 hypothetical protein EV189_1413 [Motilibacter rhizosphaerae]
MALHRLHCTRCGATWPSEADPESGAVPTCPVCLLEVTGNPNSGGSPSPSEDVLEEAE